MGGFGNKIFVHYIFNQPFRLPIIVVTHWPTYSRLALILGRARVVPRNHRDTCRWRESLPRSAANLWRQDAFSENVTFSKHRFSFKCSLCIRCIHIVVVCRFEKKLPAWDMLPDYYNVIRTQTGDWKTILVSSNTILIFLCQTFTVANNFSHTRNVCSFHKYFKIV